MEASAVPDTGVLSESAMAEAQAAWEQLGHWGSLPAAMLRPTGNPGPWDATRLADIARDSDAVVGWVLGDSFLLPSPWRVDVQVVQANASARIGHPDPVDLRTGVAWRSLAGKLEVSEGSSIELDGALARGAGGICLSARVRAAGAACHWERLFPLSVVHWPPVMLEVLTGQSTATDTVAGWRTTCAGDYVATLSPEYTEYNWPADVTCLRGRDWLIMLVPTMTPAEQPNSQGSGIRPSLLVEPLGGREFGRQGLPQGAVMQSEGERWASHVTWAGGAEAYAPPPAPAVHVPEGAPPPPRGRLIPR